MATNIKLSKITKVDLRDCWQNEANDFTPWLASEENIALLADAIGMNELEVRSHRACHSVRFKMQGVIS